jgi:hypothetical protein
MPLLENYLTEIVLSEELNALGHILQFLHKEATFYSTKLIDVDLNGANMASGVLVRAVKAVAEQICVFPLKKKVHRKFKAFKKKLTFIDLRTSPFVCSLTHSDKHKSTGLHLLRIHLTLLPILDCSILTFFEHTYFVKDRV